MMFKNIKVHAGFSRVLTKDEKRLQRVYAKLDKIKEYYDKHGNLPTQTSGSLGQWIGDIRKARKGNCRGIWDNRYIVYAISIGLPKDIFESKVLFQVVCGKIDKLKEHYDKHGKFPVQTSGSLGRWIVDIRQAKKGKGSSTWDNNYLVYAISIGLPKDIFDSEDRLQVVYGKIDEIKEFVDEHGKYPSQRRTTLGRWLDSMRQAKKGKSKSTWDDKYLTYAISIGLPKDMFDVKRKIKV